MARVGDTCVSIGNADWFLGDSVSIDPVSILPLNNIKSVLSQSVSISGDTSYSEDTEDILYYDWSISGPSGAVIPYVSDLTSSFTLDTDTIGLYSIQLTIVGANGGCGNTDSMSIYCFRSSSPHHEATALDTSYLWELLPTAWGKLDKDTRIKIEIFWRGFLQCIGADLNSLMAFDVSKSILNASSFIASRYYSLSLVTSLADSQILVWPSVTLAQGSVLTGSQFTALLSPPSFSFSAVITGHNSISVTRTDSFQPSTSDIGGEVTVSYGSNIIITKVSNIVTVSSDESTYILPSKLIDPSYIGTECSVQLTCIYSRGPLPIVSEDGDTSIISLPSSINSDASLVGGSPINQNTSYETLPYLFMPNAWRDGIRQGDEAIFSLNNVFNGVGIEFSMEVAGVVNSDKGDYVAVKPQNSQTFSELLQDICTVLFPDISTAYTEVSSYLRDSVIPRSVSNSFKVLSISLPLSGNLNTILFELVAIYRKSVGRLDGRIRDIGVLREYIEIHDQDSTNNFVLTESLRAKFLGRPQINLLENSGFTCVPHNHRVEGINYTLGDLYLSVPSGSAALNLCIGDLLVLISPSSVESYTVRRIEGLRIYTQTTPNRTLSNVEMLLRPANEQGWVIFEDKVPSGDVDNLWAEAVTVELIERVEKSYGEIVNLSYSEWLKLGTPTSYLNTVRALYIGLVKGASVHNLERTVSAILGSPYTPERVEIRDITLNSRSSDGVTYAKLLCEVINDVGEGLGLISDFYIPTDAEHAVPGSLTLSASGNSEQLKIGDIIPAGTCLSNIITVDDDLPGPENTNKFSIRLTSGVLPATTFSLDLVEKYVSLIKPSHTDFTITPVHFVADDETIDSSVIIKMRKKMFDTPYGLHGPAEILDDDIPGIGKVDTRPFMVLTTWFPSDGNIVNIDDGVYRLTSATGGLETPLSSYDFTTIKFIDGAEDVDVYSIETNYDAGHWIESGDAVIIKGVQDSPIFYINSVVSDTELILAYPRFILDVEDIEFTVVRFIDDILLDQEIESTVNIPSINVIELGARASNVSRGDVVCFDNNIDIKRPIARMRGTVAVLESAGYPTITQQAVSSGSRVIIRRDSIRPKHVGSITARAEIIAQDTYKLALVSHSSVDIAGVQVGDYLDGIHLVTAIFYNRQEFSISTLDSMAPPLGQDLTFSVFNSTGIEGNDALDLTDNCVGSSSHIEVKFGQYSRDDILNAQGHLVPPEELKYYFNLLMNAQGVDYYMSPGALVKLVPIGSTYRNTSLPNLGDGAGVLRALSKSGSSVILNYNLNNMPDTVYKLSVIVQNKVKSLM